MRFLMIDKILELKKGETATGIKNPSFEECSLPGLGITGKMPRTLILEAVGQLAAWLIMVTRNFEVRPIIASFGKVEFTGDADAGDQLVIQDVIPAVAGRKLDVSQLLHFLDEKAPPFRIKSPVDQTMGVRWTHIGLQLRIRMGAAQFWQ